MGHVTTSERKYRLFLTFSFMKCKEKQRKGKRPEVFSHELSDKFPYWFSFMQWAMADRLFHADGTDRYYPDTSIEMMDVECFSNLINKRDD